MSAKAPAKNAKDNRTQAMEKYIAEIDRFATILRDQQEEITVLVRDAAIAKDEYERKKDAVREAKESEHNTVSLLLKFIKPGTIDLMPLFDQMDTADEEVHGENSTEWRKEPISALKLSAMAMRYLIEADIVLVGQLQDRVMKGSDWAKDLDIADGVVQAIEAKLHAFIEERTGGK
jgi:preprotein translocase subunit SecA